MNSNRDPKTLWVVTNRDVGSGEGVTIQGVGRTREEALDAWLVNATDTVQDLWGDTEYNMEHGGHDPETVEVMLDSLTQTYRQFFNNPELAQWFDGGEAETLTTVHEVEAPEWMEPVLTE
jgi:hypothetical protein